MKTAYIADDGTMFDNEEKCLDYECKNRSIEAEEKGIIRGIGSYGQDLKFSEEEFCDEATVVYFENDKSIEIFNDRCEWEHITPTRASSPGCYFWNDGRFDHPYEDNTWVKVSDILDFYKDKLALLTIYAQRLGDKDVQEEKGEKEEKKSFEPIRIYVYEKYCDLYTNESNGIMYELISTSPHIKVIREKCGFVEVGVDKAGEQIIELLNDSDMIIAYKDKKIEDIIAERMNCK